MNVGPPKSQLHPTVATVSVAQICQSAGYKAAQSSALETLTDIAGRYLRAVGDSAAASANSGGRTECNLFDIVAALENLGSVVGSVGSHKSRCLISSPVLKEIKEFVTWNGNCPFPHPIPKETWVMQKKNVGNEMGLRHVPRWLPEMPAMIRNETMEIGEEEQRPVEEERMVQKEKMKIRGLPEKRLGKVKFRIGGGSANTELQRNGGVFSRNGNGKRILCQDWNDG